MRLGDQQRHVAALLITHVRGKEHWKERNRRVFKVKTMTDSLVFNYILEEMGLRQATLRAPSTSSSYVTLVSL